MHCIKHALYLEPVCDFFLCVDAKPNVKTSIKNSISSVGESGWQAWNQFKKMDTSVLEPSAYNSSTASLSKKYGASAGSNVRNKGPSLSMKGGENKYLLSNIPDDDDDDDEGVMRNENIIFFFLCHICFASVAHVV